MKVTLEQTCDFLNHNSIHYYYVAVDNSLHFREVVGEKKGISQDVTQEHIESLCMRWIIDNWEKYMPSDLGWGYSLVKDYFSKNKLSIDLIITLALEMNK